VLKVRTDPTLSYLLLRTDPYLLLFLFALFCQDLMTDPYLFINECIVYVVFQNGLVSVVKYNRWS
jgi:hypothetical protein